MLLIVLLGIVTFFFTREGWLLNMINGMIFAAMLVYWFFAGFFTASFFRSRKESLLLLNAAALCMLLIMVVMEVVGSVLGDPLHSISLLRRLHSISLLFYTPILLVDFTRQGFISSAMQNLPLSLVMFFAFCFLVIISFLGRIFGERRRNIRNARDGAAQEVTDDNEDISNVESSNK